MRSKQEIYDLVLNIAREDELIRAVLLAGSRANPNVPEDRYQDYDLVFFVTDITPFYNKTDWINQKFGKPLLLQMPEIMRNPENNGDFVYLMIFPDGNRIDLTITNRKYQAKGEPGIKLLDKDAGNGFLPDLPPPDDTYWHIKKPDTLFYESCCNNFWWCLNNVAKGIARDELPYVMDMLNGVVREELHSMIDWYIGVQHGFNCSPGKAGKYYKHYLPEAVYKHYTQTYPDSEPDHIWTAVAIMADLFHQLAVQVAEHFEFQYNLQEEQGLYAYIDLVKNWMKEDKSKEDRAEVQRR